MWLHIEACGKVIRTCKYLVYYIHLCLEFRADNLVAMKNLQVSIPGFSKYHCGFQFHNFARL